MRERHEEEPEPDEEPDQEPETVSAPTAPVVPAVPMGEREFEYRTELLTSDEVVDGSTLAGLLTTSSSDGWSLVEIVTAGEKHAVLLRKAKKIEKESRRVGFAPPDR